MNWLSLLTAFGMGANVTALVQAWRAQWSKKTNEVFVKKQEAYIGLLDAYRRAAVVGTDEAAKIEATNEAAKNEAAKNFAYWQFRCELVAPIAIIQAINRIVETNNDPIARSQAEDELKATIRRELRIAK